MTLIYEKPAQRKRRDYVATGDVGKRLAEAMSLQAQIQELEEKLAPLREWFLAHMQKQDLATLTQGDFVVTRKVRHNYTYSPECERDIYALRTLQRWEQSTGIASDNPTVYVAFSTAKPKK